jgi:MoaA/NifB/PqqE/SkfB family radical SAM enzyme
MPVNFLDLHIVDFCQLSCRHCYLNKGSNAYLRVIVMDGKETGKVIAEKIIEKVRK